MRIGYGTRHPELLDTLQRVTPAATLDTAWFNGALPLRVAAYTEPVPLPDELITSIRCVVVVDDQILVCRNADGIHHTWPGGRRRPGESYAQTAIREVHEETGWHLDPATVRELGWIHIHHLTPQPSDHPYPHPDFLQIVLRANANRRDGGDDSQWTDLEGYELHSELRSPQDAWGLVDGDPLCRAFIPMTV